MIEAILMETPCRSKRTVPLFTLALQCETEPLPLPILTSVFVVLAGGCQLLSSPLSQPHDGTVEHLTRHLPQGFFHHRCRRGFKDRRRMVCLLYTSDAADE